MLISSYIPTQAVKTKTTHLPTIELVYHVPQQHLFIVKRIKKMFKIHIKYPK